MTKRTGFTMIELLVVMAILGVLMTIGAANYMKSLSRGRDAKRVEDMKTIQKGFELYYAKNDSYDDDCTLMAADREIFPSGTLPTHPKNGAAYIFECNPTNFFYCAQLENPTTYGNSVCTDFNDVSTCTFSQANQTHYCVVSLQE